MNVLKVWLWQAFSLETSYAAMRLSFRVRLIGIVLGLSRTSIKGLPCELQADEDKIVL